ncbi:MAG TPA: DUF418 domain-containing protein [Bacillus bacterium]|uniref:DUF418 domain-containing protein n=1 Tax=Siminovitchia fordii TaxID=254759 RepID=A0ABQ4K4L2_9BACI|nr:DUF418 domain-containing protein [Siminovitchia fordii]GIN20678.1 hypothetical protein J1TS3_18120 [Siminovitchia fordii]HBZ08687.1 DUF418 domain-containing protein [Bacillus sp. (in: firmicutes)]
MTNMTKRVNAIDGIRGFSLLGILLANLLIFQYGIWGKDELEFYSVSSADSFFNIILHIAVEESFMPIFTFLFGYSMIMMKESLENKGLKVKRYFVRRSVFLLVIGWIHSTFLWEGDILFFYGLMGFFLLLFLNRKKTTLLVWGIILFSLMALLLGIGAFIDEGNTGIVDAKKLGPYMEKTIDVYGEGTYLEIMHHRNNEAPIEEDSYLLFFLVLFAPFFTAPMFLFGMYVAKKKIFLNPLKEKRLYQYAAAWLIPLGLGLKAIYHIFPEYSWTEVSNTLGGPLLSVGYIFAIAYLYSRALNWPILKMLESVGKLSMTNYLMQTVICTTIFYGYGLGQFGKMGVGASIILGFAIFGLQMWISHYYLKYFRYGPIEKLNRIWTHFSFNGRPKEKRPKEKTA